MQDDHRRARRAETHAGLRAPAAGVRLWRRWRVWLLPAVALLAVTLPKLDQGAFRTDTGWYAAIAVQAWRTGSLWTLFGEPGQVYFNKPPLGFWIHGLALHAGGVSLVAARLPSVLAAIVGVFATVGTARELGGRRVAVLAGLSLALTYEYFRRVREISLDLWQACFVMLAVWLVAAGVARGRGWLVLLAGIPIGLGLMTKPLVALLALPMLAAWMLAIGRWRQLGWLAGATALAGLVAGPWHASMHAIHGDEFVRQYFGAEIADRAAGEMVGGIGSVKPWWYYLHLLATTCWPALGFAALALITRARGCALGKNERLWIWATVWAGGWLVVLSVFPDKRPRYALVVYPAIAVLASLWLAHHAWPWLRWAIDRGLTVFVLGLVIAMAALAALPVRVQRPEAQHWHELHAYIEREAIGEVWQGAFVGARGARVYLRHGLWPVPTHNRWGERIDTPEPGAVLLYHVRDGLVPGPDERVLFRSGDVSVTRLEHGPWRPRRAPDPGD